jgi:hypothetical protein
MPGLQVEVLNDGTTGMAHMVTNPVDVLTYAAQKFSPGSCSAAPSTLTAGACSTTSREPLGRLGALPGSVAGASSLRRSAAAGGDPTGVTRPGGAGRRAAWAPSTVGEGGRVVTSTG